MIPVIKAAIAHLRDSKTRIQMSYTGASPHFSAAMRPRADGTPGSSVFSSVGELAAFIQGRVSSYGPSLQPEKPTKAGLYKEHF